MISRRYFCGLKRALFVGSFCLGFTKPALAQDASPPATDTKPADAPPEADKPAEPPAPEAKPEEKPAVAAEAKVEVPTPAGPAEPPAAAASDPEREKAVGAIGIERLPGSAFPEPQPRGIKGGSLWFTMHGLQWPYMPAMAGEPATRVGISGSVWSDLSVARIYTGDKGQSTNRTRWASQMRGVVR